MTFWRSHWSHSTNNDPPLIAHIEAYFIIRHHSILINIYIFIYIVMLFLPSIALTSSFFLYRILVRKCPLPYKHFEDILMYYPHAIHGYSKDGCAVVYEVCNDNSLFYFNLVLVSFSYIYLCPYLPLPSPFSLFLQILGKAQPKELKLRGITPEHLAWHFTLRNEVALSLDPPASSRSHPQYAPYSRLMTVLDVEGVRVVDITADVIAFIKQSSEIMDTYYPRKVFFSQIMQHYKHSLTFTHSHNKFPNIA